VENEQQTMHQFSCARDFAKKLSIKDFDANT
jgi:hypothetical protein